MGFNSGFKGLISRHGYIASLKETQIFVEYEEAGWVPDALLSPCRRENPYKPI
jgi:hypothetical protein